jgi:hypothetical protein
MFGQKKGYAKVGQKSIPPIKKNRISTLEVKK